MKKLLLLLLLSLGLIGSSWSLSLVPTDEERLERLHNERADITAVIRNASEIYEMQVNVLIEKRKLLNPESNQEEIDEIIKLGNDAEKRCFDAFRNYWNKSKNIWNAMDAIYYQEYDQAIIEAKVELEEVNNRCSLSMDESCEKDLYEAFSNYDEAQAKRIAVMPTYEKRHPDELLKYFCPKWKILYFESIDKINDSDS